MDSVEGWCVVIYMCVSLSEARNNVGAFRFLVLLSLVNAIEVRSVLRGMDCVGG